MNPVFAQHDRHVPGSSSPMDCAPSGTTATAMSRNVPLVTVGIPTCNRATLLSRSIESALNQDYGRLELIIADNASTDATDCICREYERKDDRVRYIRHASNIGAAANFEHVLREASGEYFMWLGDDDWIDTSYVSHCLAALQSHPDTALASGAAIYYQAGERQRQGKRLNLMNPFWAFRIIRYYFSVTDNGVFYGLMRTSQVQQVEFNREMGGDWHIIANIAMFGKCRTCTDVFVHRELGGATASYSAIAKAIGLSPLQAKFPMTAIAIGAFRNIIWTGVAFRTRNLFSRAIVASLAFAAVMVRPTIRRTIQLRRYILTRRRHIGCALP